MFLFTRRRVMSALLSMGLIASIGGLPSASGSSLSVRKIACTDRSKHAHRLVMKVDGEKATGHFALPKTDPKTLVVYGHGYGHTSYSWKRHMQVTARHGMAAVTMDYRGSEILPDDNGDGLPGSRGWPAMAGAQDLIAATQLFDRSCPSIERIVIFGVSMGANMTGLAVAIAGEEGLMKWDHGDGDDEGPLFDFWFDIEGATNVTETYLEARGVAASGNETAVNAQEDIEKEMGGPIESNRDAYLERTVAARGDDIAAAGIEGVVMIHALNDGLVPYNQSREMATVLRGLQIPVDFFTVTTRDKDSLYDSYTGEQTTDTTITGYTPVGGTQLSGHASEKSDTHIIMNAAFEQLWALGSIRGLESVVFGTDDNPDPQYIGVP